MSSPPVETFQKHVQPISLFVQPAAQGNEKFRPIYRFLLGIQPFAVLLRPLLVRLTLAVISPAALAAAVFPWRDAHPRRPHFVPYPVPTSYI